MNKNYWRTLTSGNIVRWNGDLWIVQEITDIGVRLISFDVSGMLAYVTKIWPEEKNRRVQSIEYVSDNAEKLISDCINDSLKQLEIKKNGIVISVNDGDSADVVADKVEKAIGAEMVVREGYQQKGGVNDKPKSEAPPAPKGQRGSLN